MRPAFFVALLALLVATSVQAAHASDGEPHLRGLSPGARRVIQEALERSAVFRGLSRRLANTDVVVYVTEQIPTGVAVSDVHANLRYLTSTGGLRFVLVWVDRWNVTPDTRIELLGHELQHALEVAAAPEVKDAASLAACYRRIGYESQSGRFETKAARTVSHRIRQDLG
ncbi:MAG TPA: hypothetical protein VGK32_18175 [Vicinamibacterales bacterium]|jgi:hypothetical protein